jgi:NADPH-dependent 2,4-dienoyl-CoA reductase/sulfur reductase-like enzyme
MREHTDYLIVGGGPAGTKAAESIRQDDPDGRILLVTRESHRLYDRTGLPGYIKGTKTREQLFMRTEEQYRAQRIERLNNNEVTRLDPKKNKATLQDGRDVTFKKALISSGSTPFHWDVPGADKEGVVRLNTLDDADKILGLMSSARDMVIVGGGFISLEFCGIAGAHDKKATVLVREPYYWANILDEVSGTLITKYLTKNGITVRVNEEIAEVIGDRRVEAVKTKQGETIPTQMVGVGIGVKRNLDFLQGTPVKIEKGIITNEFLESSVRGIWAAGDVAEFQDAVLHIRHMMGNWRNASDQGIYVGHELAGAREPFRAVSNYSITTFDMNVSFIGDPKPEGAEVIERGDRENSFGRIFVKDGSIVGATLIARPTDKPGLLALIRQRTPIDTALKAILADHRTPIPVPPIK